MSYPKSYDPNIKEILGAGYFKENVPDHAKEQSILNQRNRLRQVFDGMQLQNQEQDRQWFKPDEIFLHIWENVQNDVCNYDYKIPESEQVVFLGWGLDVHFDDKSIVQ